jgi:hypothetical protein
MLRFEDIERIIGAKLPASARRHPAWWSNSASGHVNAQAWLGAGFKAEQVDLAEAQVVFRRGKDGAREQAAPGPGFLERIHARLGGTVTIAPGVDLTEPLWEAEGGEV